MIFKEGDLVTVKTPLENESEDLCIITSLSIPTIYKTNEFFMVYSISKMQKFITVRKFMQKIG